MSKQGRLIKNIFILLIGVIGTKLINFIMLPLFTSWLSVEEYGTIDIFTTIVQIAVPLCTLQLDQAVFRFMIEDHTLQEKSNTVSTGLKTMSIVVILIDIPVCVLLFLLNNRLYLLYLLAVNLQCYYAMAQQIVRGNGLNKVYSANSILLAFINVIFSIIFIRFWGLGVYGYVLAFIIAHCIALVYMLIRANFRSLFLLKNASMAKMKELLNYSVPMILNNVSWWILNASDKMILNLFCGVNANGIYGAAGKIPGIVTIIYNVFHMAWQESTSREKDGDIAIFFSDIFRKLFAILAYITIVLLAMCKLFSDILINRKFSESYNHMPILIVALLFMCIAQFYGGIYIGIQRPKELGNTALTAAVINLFVDILLVKKVGIYAASLSTLVAYAVLFVIRYFRVQKMFNLNYRVKENTVSTILIIIAFGLSYLKNLYLSIAFVVLITIIMFFMYKDIVEDILNIAKSKVKSH